MLVAYFIRVDSTNRSVITILFSRKVLRPLVLVAVYRLKVLASRGRARGFDPTRSLYSINVIWIAAYLGQNYDCGIRDRPVRKSQANTPRKACRDWGIDYIEEAEIDYGDGKPTVVLILQVSVTLCFTVVFAPRIRYDRVAVFQLSC